MEAKRNQPAENGDEQTVAEDARPDNVEERHERDVRGLTVQPGGDGWDAGADQSSQKPTASREG